MPSFNIIKKCDIDKNSFRINALLSMFDINEKHLELNLSGEIPIEKIDWQIGVIVGASGTGKSTIAKEIFKDNYITGFEYDNRSVIENMPQNCSVEEICKTFNSVGFNSIPSYFKPYAILSEGEKMRVNLARAILEKKDLIVFDEYTSTIDRNVAKIGSFALAKAIRKTNKKFVAVTCHEDVIEWLEPDWIYNTNTNLFFLIDKNKNIKDQKYTWSYTKQQNIIGECLANIII